MQQLRDLKKKKLPTFRRFSLNEIKAPKIKYLETFFKNLFVYQMYVFLKKSIQVLNCVS